jgi:hypothetical protein
MEAMDEVNETEETTNNYLLMETPKLFQIIMKVENFVDTELSENQWQIDVWSPLLQRTTDITDGILVDWERYSILLSLKVNQIIINCIQRYQSFETSQRHIFRKTSS